MGGVTVWIGVGWGTSNKVQVWVVRQCGSRWGGVGTIEQQGAGVGGVTVWIEVGWGTSNKVH